MAKPLAVNIRRIFDIALSICVVAAGLCLIGGCIAVYTSPDGYSREAVAAVFSKITIPVYFAVAMILIGCGWELIKPSSATYRKAPKNYARILDTLHSKRDLSADEQIGRTIAALQRRRGERRAIGSVLTLIGCAVFLFYAVQPRNYDTADINSSMIHAMWVAIPCFVIPAVFAVIRILLDNRSYDREIELLKILPLKDDADNTMPPVCANPPALPSAVRYSVLAAMLIAALAAIAYGFFTGGTASVLAKAVKICTECIGLG